MAQRLRIFVSSPTDVPDERLRADLIIDKLTVHAERNAVGFAAFALCIVGSLLPAWRAVRLVPADALRRI
jgi:ABC-type lipoprotein release transport system permease subunit